MRDLIVIGASAGGVEALRAIARGLPAELPAAILVAVHLSPRSPYLLPEILRGAGPLDVAEGADGAVIQPGRIYLAVPDHHLLVRGNRLSVTRGPKENRARPAIDPLFRTAALHYGPRVVGVVLTGMLDDGTAGLAAVKERGGLAIAQDPNDALYPSMPTSAMQHVACDHIARLADIPSLLTRVVREQVPPSARAAASHRLEVESKFDEMEIATMENLDSIGSRAAVTCPECHGPLWKIADPSLERYRCLVGHGYTARALGEALTESQEGYLWQALRLMKERASVIFEMAARAGDRQSEAERTTYEAQLRRLQRNMATIEAMLEDDGTWATSSEAPPPVR